jgi:light-harvesting complex I chlorophyll a/b binding protein 1
VSEVTNLLGLQEIKNGRLAMWAASGLILQGCTTHQGGLEALAESLKANSF